MQPNGLCSIRYAPLMDQYKAVKDFLNNQRNNKLCKKGILESCKLSSTGESKSRTLHFVTESQLLIEQVLSTCFGSSWCSSDEFITPMQNDMIDQGIQEETPQLFKLNCELKHQFKGKTYYHSASIQRVYKESGLQRLEEAINVILSSERFDGM